MNAISVKEIEHGVAVAEREGLGEYLYQEPVSKKCSAVPAAENGHTVPAAEDGVITGHTAPAAEDGAITGHTAPAAEDGAITGHTVHAADGPDQKRTRKRCFKC
ncbi:CotG/ExsB N-terminal domain-containing protein [Bacillus velezensis]